MPIEVAKAPQGPYLPAGAHAPLTVFDLTGGINTSTTRVGVQDNQAYWIDGFFPLGPGQLRTLYDLGSTIFTTTLFAISTASYNNSTGQITITTTGNVSFGVGAIVYLTGITGPAFILNGIYTTVPTTNFGTTVTVNAAPGLGLSTFTTGSVAAAINLYYFYTLKGTAYVAVVLGDGSVVQVNVLTSAITTILPSGTINNPLQNHVGFAQYGQQYLIIVADQINFNGYFVWDGTLLYQAGTLAPFVKLTNPGAAYQSVPVVAVSGGTGTGATLVAVIAGGLVTNVYITNPGSGYSVGDVVSVVFSGGNLAGSGATFTAVMSTVSAGSGATFTVQTATDKHGNTFITGITVTAGGSGYSPYTTFAVALASGGTPIIVVPAFSIAIAAGVITAVTVLNAGSFTGAATFTAAATDPGVYHIVSITVGAGGTNYSPSTTVATTGPPANEVVKPVLKPVISAGVITSVQVVNGGVYSSNSAPTVAATDTKTNAAATVTLMPFGVQGVTVETYQSRVWVGDAKGVCTFTAPASVSDFATSDGGGQFQSADSFLRTGWIRFFQANGFLYLIADSSINYISGVQTTVVSNVPTTTFTNQNADPEVGTVWPWTVAPIGRNVAFANAYGAFVTLGAEARKVSEALDGVWNSVGNQGNGYAFNLVPSVGRAIVFGKKVWVVILPIVDPISSLTVNKLLIFDGKKWFAASQGTALNFLATQEVNSILTAYGTDGLNIYPLFQTAGTGFTKALQTRFWFDPGGLLTTKTQTRLWFLAQYYSGTSTTTVTIDNESGSTAAYTLTPSGTGYFVAPPQAVGQQGVLSGMTFKTVAADMAIIMAQVDSDLYDYRG